MSQGLSVEDEDLRRELVETRLRNEDVRRMLVRWLVECPRAINVELLEEIVQDGSLPDEAAFLALLVEICGLDPETDRRHWHLVRDYLRPSVRMLDAQKYACNPYYRDIAIPHVSCGRWELKHESYAPCEAFLRDDLLLCEDFREIPRIGFFREAFSYPVVMEDAREWMAVKPSEIESMSRAIEFVEGDVVAFGLGLGYFAYMASLKENVRSVTVVEQDVDVVRLFEDHILPQFRHKAKVRIVVEDAFQFVSGRMRSTACDWAFVDLWHDASDGLEPYLEMKSLERLHPGTRFLYWAEGSLLSSLRWWIFDRVVESAASYDEIVRRLGVEALRAISVDSGDVDGMSPEDDAGIARRR